MCVSVIYLTEKRNENRKKRLKRLINEHPKIYVQMFCCVVICANSNTFNDCRLFNVSLILFFHSSLRFIRFSFIYLFRSFVFRKRNFFIFLCRFRFQAIKQNEKIKHIKRGPFKFTGGNIKWKPSPFNDKMKSVVHFLFFFFFWILSKENDNI